VWIAEESQECLGISKQQAITSDQACYEVAREQIEVRLVVMHQQLPEAVVKQQGSSTWFKVSQIRQATAHDQTPYCSCSIIKC
jgi:hypothetical protein